ncbi:type II/IV secretion system protein [Clostridium niameyense]|uniref:Type II/IV secretion system protein n=1 Tax=Clostridium niameyense TaxID=1622073 RepID=A0A6M0R7X3_9CLOT|nr:GspE/PulE family protein [Clostridium niameyense]NEZ46331.1 type II/IV secretion system protein [Clostridium niameyense]
MEYVSLDSENIEQKAIETLPEYICIKNGIIPFKLIGNKLFIATARNLDQDTINQIRFLSKKEIEIVKYSKSHISYLLKTCYKKKNLEKSLKNLKTIKKIEKNKKDYRSLDAPIIKLTDSIIEDAIWKKASDIHIEPFEHNALIRFRIDGMLYEYRKISKELYKLMCTRIKIMSYMDITEKRFPQDGKIYEEYKKHQDFRISTLPTVHGEKIVIRILYKNEKIISLNSLGFLEEDIPNIRKMIKHQNGVILVTGPTGSGKSTTIYSLLNEINDVHKNIVTIEEPVEYTIPGINQVNVDYKRKLTFLQGLKSVLRQDPDVIMIGEIRDEETAKVALRAGITGHLVLSTLHTNGASESIVRLLDMGVEPYILSDALKGIIAQKLIRKICPYCRCEYKASKEELEVLNLQGGENLLFKSKGCKNCNYTGYLGRTVIYEYINIGYNEKYLIKNLYENNDIEANILKNKLVSSCRDLVIDGVTSFQEFKRIIY